MSKPTIKSLTDELAQSEKSFERLSDGYAEGVKRIAEQREQLERQRRDLFNANLRVLELERRLEKAERAAAQFADANAKAIRLLEWMTEGDRVGDDGCRPRRPTYE